MPLRSVLAWKIFAGQDQVVCWKIAPVTLQDIKDAYVEWKVDGNDKWLRSIVKPFEVLLDPLPKIIIKDSAVDAICHGADLAVVGIAKLDGSSRKRNHGRYNDR